MPRRRRPPRAGALSELPPLKILGQIAALQALFYACAIVLTLFNELVAGQPWSIDLVLGWASVRADTTRGWLMAFLWILNGGFFMSLTMVLIIARSKLVPDFSITTHFLHLLVVSLYSGGLPRNASWWLTMIVSSSIGVSLGMWGCQYRELRPMSFGGGGGKSKTAASNGKAGTTTTTLADGTVTVVMADDDITAGDEEQGFSRGRGRGRGRDGAGEYEMVKMDGTAAP